MCAMWSDHQLTVRRNTTSWTWDNDTTTATSTLSDSAPTEDPYAESPALFYFRRILPGIFMIIAVPGNFLSMAVMCRKFFRSTSAGIYLFALLVSDTVYIFTNYSFIFWLINNFKTFELVHNSVSCKLWVYLMETSGYISSWVLVAMTIERAVVVRAPHRRSVVCTRKRAGITIALIAVVMATLNSYVLVTFASVRNSNTNPIRPTRNCYFAKPFSSYGWLLVIYNLTPFMTYAFIPACCIVVGNVIIVRTLMRRPKLVAAKSLNTMTHEAESKKVAVLLTGASVFFLLATVPVTTLVFMEQILNKFLRLHLAALNSVYLYVMVVLPLNQTFNFAVYLTAGSAFRKELRAMLTDCFGRVRRPTMNRYGPNRLNVTGNSWKPIIQHQRFISGSSYTPATSTSSTDASSTDNTYI